ncbi:MAG: asparaginase domain-containing protein [Candidatus Woesearchaeota archaeon]
MTETQKRPGLHVIIAGGSIDFRFNPAYERSTKKVDASIPRTHSIVPYFLRQRVKIPSDQVNFSRVAIKDSRDMKEKDLVALAQEVRASPYQKVLVTYGIVKMEEAADFLREHNLDGRSVGIVGSHMPFTEYQSDAGFHLGYAIGQMHSVKPGVHTFHPSNNAESVKDILGRTIIHITGGTIDSGYSDAADTATPYEHSKIPGYLHEVVGVELDEPDFVFKEICMKDSRQLGKQDIDKLLDEARRNEHKQQIVTIGTYALPDEAGRFEHMIQMGDLPKSKYVFVGAMFPDDVHLNDGWFNLGHALGRIDSLPQGAFASMHSWITSPRNVVKQLSEARFGLYDKSLVF